MRSLGFSGAALILMIAPGAAQAASDSVAMGASAPAATVTKVQVKGHNWGGRYNGRWIGGWRAPGGWGGYRTAVRGYVLPSYWISPRFYIGNYARYGFHAPAAGYGWSRYYDDAVLTDRDGRVVETVPGVQWDRYDAYDEIEGGWQGGEDYSDSYGYSDDRGPGVYVGPRKRVKDRELPYDYNYDYRRGDDGVTYNGRWSGTWTGGYEAGTQVYKGTFEGTYDGSRPHWAHRGPPPPHVVYQGGYGYGYGGYGYAYGPAFTTITIQSAPIVTTTTTVTEEVTYAAAPRKRIARKVWKPRPKARCVCR